MGSVKQDDFGIGAAGMEPGGEKSGEMKLSAFTVFADGCDGARIAFNTANGALALVGEGAGEAELREGGFMAVCGADEEAGLARRFMDDMNQTGFLSLCIAPTMACNLRCAYCYEDHEAVRMDDATSDAVKRFICRRHDAYGFTELEVLWYGGEPLLELERIGELSEWMLGWCAENGVAYRARITTNASLVDEDAARRLAGLCVESAMPTLDGLAARHDARRPGADGAGSFEKTLAGVEALAAAGIEVGANLNLGWDNIDDYRKLREMLAGGRGQAVYASHLRNYGGWCPGCKEGCDEAPRGGARGGVGAFGGSAFEDGGTRGRAGIAMSRRAYAEKLFELYRETDPSPAAVYAALQAKRSFCRGKMASYFVIDPQGFVCRCDGHMRDAGKRLFNVRDDGYPLSWPETESPYERNPRCRGCAIMPLCLGDCDWEWGMFEENCSALKYTLDDYLRLFVEKSGARLEDGEKMLQLVFPADMDRRHATPFTPFSGDGVMR